MIKLYTDAATKGNPGPTGLGMLIVKDGHQQQLKAFLPRASNHQGEFAAAIEGFAYLKKHFSNQETVLFYTDSRLLSDAVGKEHARHYENELNELLTSMDDFKTVVVQWVPEKENQGAHQRPIRLCMNGSISLTISNQYIKLSYGLINNPSVAIIS